MRHDGCQRILCIVRSHRDKADVKLALDFVGKNNVNLHLEWPIRHVHFQSVLAYGRNVLLIDIYERNVIASARKAPADNPTDRSCSNDNHTHNYWTSCLPAQTVQR